MGEALDAIVLLGPTTTGKTERAFDLARRIGGAVINADKFYLFAGYGLGTGSTDRSDWPDVQGHLYGVLPAAHQAAPNVGVWVRAMLERVRSLRRAGITPIIEGSSFGLASAALRTLRQRGARVGAVGLEWDDPSTLESRLERRVSRAVEAGVVDETRTLLAQGLEHGYVMRKGVVYQPLVEHLRGQRSLRDAQRAIVTHCCEAAHAQLMKFKRLRGVRWLTTSAHNPPPAMSLLACARG